MSATPKGVENGSTKIPLVGTGSRDDIGDSKTPINAKMQKKFQDKKLQPLSIQKTDIDVQLVKTDSGIVVENGTYLENFGIVFNNKVVGGPTSDLSGGKGDKGFDNAASFRSMGSNQLQREMSGKSDTYEKSTTEEEYKTMNKSGSKIATITVKNATNLQKVDSTDGSDFSDANKKIIVIKSPDGKEPDVELNLDDFKKIGNLGAGSQGSVDKMVHDATGKIIALKVMKLSTDENLLKALKIELNTLRNCNSEYIVGCYGAFSNKDGITIALEFMDKGSLADIIKECGSLPEVIIGMITYQVLKGLEYLHKTIKVIHRDIKPSNLLLNSAGQVKIADFGVSGTINSTYECKNTWVGTLPYMSPERCKGEKYNFDTDLWSLGLTIIEMALGKYPYLEPGVDKNKLSFWDVLECISTKPVPKLPDNFTNDITDFVSICLRKETGTRSSATELLQHKFVKKYAKVGMSSFKSWLQYID